MKSDQKKKEQREWLPEVGSALLYLFYLFVCLFNQLLWLPISTGDRVMNNIKTKYELWEIRIMQKAILSKKDKLKLMEKSIGEGPSQYVH